MSGGVLPPLVSIVTTDMAAVTRGRPLTEARLQKLMETGVSWVPVNVCLTAFNTLPDPNPWGSSGDLRIVPDRACALRHVDRPDRRPPSTSSWATSSSSTARPGPACTRTQLKDALAALHAATGLSLLATFEQEFTLYPNRTDTAGAPPHAFSLEALRSVDPFAPRLAACLEEAGVQPEMVLAEYGANQFEVTHAPTDALTAADRAVAIREITREVARNSQCRASFAPKPALDQVGNGVHIHFSLKDASGRPATYDPARPGGLPRPPAPSAPACSRICRRWWR